MNKVIPHEQSCCDTDHLPLCSFPLALWRGLASSWFPDLLLSVPALKQKMCSKMPRWLEGPIVKCYSVKPGHWNSCLSKTTLQTLCWLLQSSAHMGQILFGNVKWFVIISGTVGDFNLVWMCHVVGKKKIDNKLPTLWAVKNNISNKFYLWSFIYGSYDKCSASCLLIYLYEESTRRICWDDDNSNIYQDHIL